KQLRKRHRHVIRMVNDMHQKLSRWLAANYNQVLLSSFQIAEMSHFKFKTLLKYKMDCVGERVVECEEEYTSKTCSSCGGSKNDLGGSSTYKCSFCHVVRDRDVNTAKSIFHKNVQMLV
ncbi:hypothetical protein JM18_006908, partial [Phytophthora kernoviae]